MRILILTQYYPPEVGAAPNRLFHLATSLKESGHTVTVLTALPNYPHGNIWKAYKGRIVVEEKHDGIRLIRTWLYTRRNLSFIGRLVNYISFSGLALLVSIWKVSRQDIVLVESPPLFVGIAGLIISRIKKSRFALNVSDLWVESAVSLGMVKNRTLIRVSQCVEQTLYRKTDLITGQTHGIVNTIQACISDKPVVLITNGVDGERFREVLESNGNGLRKEFNLLDRFVVGFAGLHGLMQDLETVIEAASLLRGFENIVFAFYGDGPKKEKLIELTKEARIENIKFYPPQPVERMPKILTCFDAAVIPLRRLAILKGALPSKLFEAMAAAVPIVLAAEGEAEKLVREAQCGIVVEPENPKLLAQGVLDLYHSDSYRRRLGRNGRRYVLQHYDRRHLDRKFEALLCKVYSGEKIDSTAE